jgi:hypothetical protein
MVETVGMELRETKKSYLKLEFLVINYRFIPSLIIMISYFCSVKLWNLFFE